MAHYEENLANPPLLDGTPDRAPIEGAFLDCIPSALRSYQGWGSSHWERNAVPVPSTHGQTYFLTDSTGAEAQKEWRSFSPQPWKLRISNFHACRIVVFKTGFHSGLMDQVTCQLRRVAQPHDPHHLMTPPVQGCSLSLLPSRPRPLMSHD